MLLTGLPGLGFTSPRVFTAGHGSFLIPSLFSACLPTPSRLAALSLGSVSTSSFPVCLFVYFAHQIPHVSETPWHLSFSDSCHSAECLLGPCVLLRTAVFPSFDGRVTFVGINAPQLSDPLVCWRALGRFQVVGAVNNAAVSTGVLESLEPQLFIRKNSYPP